MTVVNLLLNGGEEQSFEEFRVDGIIRSLSLPLLFCDLLE